MSERKVRYYAAASKVFGSARQIEIAVYVGGSLWGEPTGIEYPSVKVASAALATKNAALYAKP